MLRTTVYGDQMEPRVGMVIKSGNVDTHNVQAYSGGDNIAVSESI